MPKNGSYEKPTKHPLRVWRKSQPEKVSLGSLAEQAGVTAAHLSQIEHYKGRCSWDLAKVLARITHLPVDDFYLAPADEAA